MRTAVVASAAILVVALLAGAGCLGLDDGESTTDTDLQPVWVADTETSLDGNHHQPAVLRIDDEPHLAVPLNGAGEDCRVAVLRANGSERWSHDVPPADCHAHAVGDVASDAFPAEDPAVLVATGEERVLALDAASGTEILQHELPEFGYSPPVVRDGERQSLVVADFLGTVTAVGDDGSELWTHDLDAYVWEQPTRVPGPNGTERIVVAGGTTGESGLARALNPDGSVAWTSDFERPVYELARTDVDRDGDSDGDSDAVVGATSDGTVGALRTENGTGLWSGTFGSGARVATGGGAIYVTDDGGDVHRLDPADGSVRWSQSQSDGADTTPPIALADLNRSAPVPVVLDPDGRVTLHDPADGSTLASATVDAGLLAPPATGDVTGDGRDEIAIVYADGRTALFEYDG